jgi:hypothetical protein
VRLAAINGHKCVDAADHIAVAINRLECAYALLGYEPPPGDER